MPRTFRVPMLKSILLVLLLAVAICAAAIVWSFTSGLTWTGICLLVVTGPMAIIFWYMLYINPANSFVVLDEEGVYIQAAPFFKAAVPYGEIERSFDADLQADEAMQLVKEHRVMRYGKYRSGIFELPSGKKAYVLTNSDQVFGIETGERYYLIGCKGLDELRQGVAERL